MGRILVERLSVVVVLTEELVVGRLPVGRAPPKGLAVGRELAAVTVLVGYLHSPCSFPCVFVDSSFVLCGHPVRAAIHFLVS